MSTWSSIPGSSSHRAATSIVRGGVQRSLWGVRMYNGGSDVGMDDGLGWKLFAGLMVIVVGAFNVIDGLVGVTNAHQVENHFPSGRVELPLTNNIKTYSWVVL